jgi:TonB family protein
MQYLHGSTPGQAVKQPVAPPEPSTPVSASPSTAPVENYTAATPSATQPDLGVVSSTATASPSEHNFTPETIRVQELPMNLEQKNSLASKSQPTVIQVRPGSAVATKPVQQQITPPSLPLTAASNSNAALNSIVATDAPAPKPAGSFRVSQGVSQGLVVKKIAPVYSGTALQLRKEGTVELMARISKDGSVTGVRVLSGDLMLARSAVEAVKQWKYRPYLLNSEPVEIETQITVNFRLPH